jgi:DNA invertase Pin-like site-specific DNA recombinase
MKYGYARVSTAAQAKDGNSMKAQKKQLKKHGAKEIYEDVFTGVKGDRPQLNALVERLKAGDTLVVTKLDRIARTVKEGLILIDSLMDRGVKLNILNMGGLLDGSPEGKLRRAMFLAFAEFERDMLILRTQEGKAVAKLNPLYREGRPRKFTDEQLRHGVSLLENHSYKEVEAMTKISRSTLERAKKAALVKAAKDRDGAAGGNEETAPEEPPGGAGH